MSVYNIKKRCESLGVTIDSLWKKVTSRDPRFKNVSYNMFCNMHRGRYNYGISHDVLATANDILTEMEGKQ